MNSPRKHVRFLLSFVILAEVRNLLGFFLLFFPLFFFFSFFSFFNFFLPFFLFFFFLFFWQSATTPGYHSFDMAEGASVTRNLEFSSGFPCSSQSHIDMGFLHPQLETCSHR